MKVTELIDAFEATAVDSFRFLVVTRVLACLLALPILTTLMNFTGMLGGYIAESLISGMSLQLYIRSAFAFIEFEAAADIRPNEAQGGTWDVFFWVSGLEDLHGELVGRGADIVYAPIVQEAYHMLEFAARDVDGYVLGFGEPLAAGGNE
jgi:hypothetical protein